VTSRLPAVTPRKAVRALERCGWELDRVKGSHQVFGIPNTGIASSYRCTAAIWPRERSVKSSRHPALGERSF